ncbi:hypothetical protein M3Y95_00861800 [Aphelenchoides besseyi]|nr:hypothetical protein M3Y95_00861800 [Aphelenchoides besseyi]
MIWLLFLFVHLSAGAPALSPATSDRVVISRQTDTQVQGRFQNVDVSEEQIQQSKHRHAFEHLEPDPAHSIFDRGNLVANPLQRTTTANPQQQQTTKSKSTLVLVTGGSRRHAGGVNLQQQRGRRSVPVVADREYDVLVSDFNEDEAPVQVVAADDPKASTPSGSSFSTRIVSDAEIKDPRAIEAPIRQHRVHVPAHLLELQSEETEEPISSTAQSTTTTKLATSTKRITTTTTKLSTTRQPSATAPPPVEFSGEEPTGNFFDEKEEDEETTTESPATSTPTILPVQKAERALTTLLTKLTEPTTKLSTRKIESSTSPTKTQKLSAVKFESPLSEVHRDVFVPKANNFLLLDRTVRKPRRMLANFVPIRTPTTTTANSIEFEEEIVTTNAVPVPVTAPVVDLDVPSNLTESSTIAFTVIADAESTGASTKEASTKSVTVRTLRVPSSLLIKSEEETTKSQPDSELRDIAPPDEAAGVVEAKPTTRLPPNNRIALTPRPQQPTAEGNESPPQQVIPQQQPIPAFQPQFVAQPPIQTAGPQPTLNHFVIGNRRIIVPSISFEQHFAARQFGGQFPTAQFVPIQPQPVPQFVPAPQQPAPSSQLSFDAPRFQPPPVVVQPQLPTTVAPSIQRTTKSTLPDIIRTPAPVANSHIHSVNFDLYDEVGAANSN